jgi:hypothetical protein
MASATTSWVRFPKTLLPDQPAPRVGMVNLERVDVAGFQTALKKAVPARF